MSSQLITHLSDTLEIVGAVILAAVIVTTITNASCQIVKKVAKDYHASNARYAFLFSGISISFVSVLLNGINK